MSSLTRREFAQQSAALGLGLAVSLGGKAVAANDRIGVACIAAGYDQRRRGIWQHWTSAMLP